MKKVLSIILSIIFMFSQGMSFAFDNKTTVTVPSEWAAKDVESTNVIISAHLQAL